MNSGLAEAVERSWAKLGVLFGCEPADSTPDLEQLLLDTARKCPENARLVPLTVTWLVAYGSFVARHRLSRLVRDELEPRAQAALGLLIEESVDHGATRELLIVAKACAPFRPPGPLHDVQRGNTALERLSERHASELSRRWGVWTPSVTLKKDALRPVSWLLGRNPDLYRRIVRKGDLRASVLETLHSDLDGRAISESALARLSGATRTAVRKALAALELEGEIERAASPKNEREHPVRLRAAS